MVNEDDAVDPTGTADAAVDEAVDEDTAKLEELVAMARGMRPYWYEPAPSLADEMPTAGEYLSRLLVEAVDRVRGYAVGFLQDHDEEELHQLRINVRKLRALCGFARPVTRGSEILEQANGLLRGLAVPFGEVRDRDVLLAGLATIDEDGALIPSADDLEDLRLRLTGERAAFAEASESTLRSESWAEALDRIERAAELGLWRRSVPGRLPARYVVSHGLDTAWWDLADRMQYLPQLDEHEQHRVRITAKKLRYITELTADLYDLDVAGGSGTDAPPSARVAFTEACKEIQDVIGDMRDRKIRVELPGVYFHHG